ncbi:hypothetical protein [Cryptosporangium japonicum]
MLIEYWKEHRAQARQSENQRATISNLVLVIATALLVIIAQKGLMKTGFFLTVPLLILGSFGMLVSAKYYERAEYHIARARVVMDAFVSPGNAAIMQAADRMHKSNYRILRHVRVYALWIILHGLIAVTGLILTVILMIGE